MREFRIECRIRNVAAGRHVKILDAQWCRKRSFLAERHADMARVDSVAEIRQLDTIERQARDRCNAMIALLPVQRDVLVAEPLEALGRKSVIGTLGLLQAEHIGPDRLDEFRHTVDA